MIELFFKKVNSSVCIVSPETNVRVLSMQPVVSCGVFGCHIPFRVLIGTAAKAVP